MRAGGGDDSVPREAASETTRRPAGDRPVEQREDFCRRPDTWRTRSRSFRLPSRRSDLENLRHRSLCRTVGSVNFRQWQRPSSSTLAPTSGTNCAEMSLSRPDITPPPSLQIMSRKRDAKPEREKNPLTSGRLSSKPPAWTSSSDSAELLSV